MTSQAIISSDANAVIANKSSQVSKKSKSEHNDFSKVMEKNRYESQEVHDTSLKDRNRVNNKDKHEKIDFHSSRPDNDINKYKNDLSVEKKPAKSFNKEEFVQDIEDIINDVAGAYKDALNITDDELITIMEELSISLFQLPMRELAKNIVLEANGENDITGLLVNEKALNNLQSMNQFFDLYDTSTKLDMPIEELTNLVDEAISNLVTDVEVSDSLNTENSDIQLNNVDVLTNNLDFVNAQDNVDISNMSNISDVSTDNAIHHFESIDKGNGDTLDIEIVDMRNNMTNSDNSVKLERNYETINMQTSINDENNNASNNIIQKSIDNIIDKNINSSSQMAENTNLDITMQEDTSTNHMIGKNLKNVVKENLGQENLDQDTSIKNFDDKISLDNNQILNDEVMVDKDVQDIINELERGEIDTFDGDNAILNNVKDSDNNDITKSDFEKNLLDRSIKTSDNVENNESDSLNNESFANDNSQNSNQDISTDTFYDKFIANLEKSFGIEEGSIIKEVSNIKELQEVVNQIIDKIKVTINKDTTTMKLNLSPEHLGKVELEVTSKSGVLTADFTVESITAKDAIEKGLSSLIEKFEQQGIKVEAIEVSIANYDFTKDNQERKSSKDYSGGDKKKKRDGKISLDDMNMEDGQVNEERKIMSSTGIDYAV